MISDCRKSQYFANFVLVLNWIFLWGLWVAPAIAAEGVADQNKKLDSIRATRVKKVAAFKGNFPKVQVYPNFVTGGPELLHGDLSKGLTETDPVEAAYQFFELNKEMYGLNQPLTDMKVQRVDKIGLTGQTMVRLKQIYKGVEIWNSDIRATFDRAGKLNEISGSTVHDVDISTVPTIDSNSAVAIGKRESSFQNNAIADSLWRTIGRPVPWPSAQLTIMPFQGVYCLVWVVNVHMDVPESSWKYFVDARTGKVLDKRNQVIKERIFPLDPIPNPGDSVQTPRPRNLTPPSKPIPKKEVPIYKVDSVRPIPELLNNQNNIPATKSPSTSTAKPGVSTPVRLPLLKGDGNASPAEVRDMQGELNKVISPDTALAPIWQRSGRVITEDEKRKRKEAIRLRQPRSKKIRIQVL